MQASLGKQWHRYNFGSLHLLNEILLPALQWPLCIMTKHLGSIYWDDFNPLDYCYMLCLGDELLFHQEHVDLFDCIDFNLQICKDKMLRSNLAFQMTYQALTSCWRARFYSCWGKVFEEHVLQARGLLNGGGAGFCHGGRPQFPSCFYPQRILAVILHHHGREMLIIVGCLLGRLYSLQGLIQVLLLVHLLNKQADTCTISVMSH